jgi:hypothetical protein
MTRSVAYRKDMNAMDTAAAKIDFEKELKHRHKEQSAIQNRLDVEVLNKRYKDVKEGRSHLIDEDDFWASVDKLGY